MYIRFICVIWLGLGSAIAADAGNPLADLSGWSGFSEADLAKLSGDAILVRSNTGMKLARGLAVHASYLVAAPVEAATRYLITPEPAKHPQLEIYFHRNFLTEAEARFEGLKLDTAIAPVRGLLDATAKNQGLQLTAAEQSRLPKSAQARAVEAFWAETLRARWRKARQDGNLGTQSELDALLKEEPEIATRFADLLGAIKAGNAGVYYWQLAKVGSLAALNLGLISSRSAAQSRQVVDLTYYVSSGYLTSITLYELFPVASAGKNTTLVYQTTLVSAQGLAGGIGVPRRIGAKLTTLDLTRWIGIFQKAAAKRESAN